MLGYLANLHQWSGVAVDDGSVAVTHIRGPVGGDRADVFALRDLTEQPKQNRAVVSAAGGKFHWPDV